MSWVREPFTFQDLQRLLFKLAEHVKAFQGLSPAEIGDLLAHAEKCSFAPEALIVKEGSGGIYMYIIIDGEAAVEKRGRSNSVELARLGPADSFGEMALVDNETRSASVKALTPCLLVRLDDKVINARPEIGLKVYRNISRVLAARLRVADEALVWRL
ncbi:MAG TPA: cyclic nucleotide-binding domain-containing protein [Rhodocyclaceae bacterium]